MSLIPWKKNQSVSLDPVSWMQDIQSEMNRMFDFSLSPLGERKLDSGFAPLVNVKDQKEEYLVTADLPGADKDSIDVTVDHDVLTIRGEKKEESTVEEEHYLRMERSYGSFSRSLRLPTNIDSENVSASYRNGVLMVKLPKREEDKSKKIAIDVK